MLSPRVVRIFDIRGAANCLGEVRRGRTNAIENRLTGVIDEVEAEHVLGHRVGVEEAAVDVDRDDTAANVAQNVFGMQARLLERGDELVLPFTALARAPR